MKTEENILRSILHTVHEEYGKFNEKHNLSVSDKEYWEIRAESLESALRILEEQEISPQVHRAFF